MFGRFFKKNKEQISEVLQTTCEPENYNDVSEIANFFKNETGVNFDAQLSILKSKVTSFCRHRYIKSFDECLIKVKNENSLKQELIDYLTTNETYFYREFKQIENMRDEVLTSNNRVDILCAPCATGEEPYSIVIALLEAKVEQSRFHVVGIDINQEAISRAQEAHYGERNVKNLTNQIRERYFDYDGKRYVLKEFVKKMVTLKRVNIFDYEFKDLGKFDYVFSRNMLIYFDKETKIRAKKIFEEMLKDKNGTLSFGHADLF